MNDVRQVPLVDEAEETAAPRDDIVFETAELRSGYGDVPVLRGVSMQLREREVIGIIGHNGMGKTTLLRTIMGLLPSRGGRVVVDGVDVTPWAAHDRSRLGIGYVPQGRGILPGLSAHENLRLAWRSDSGETEERAIERVLDMFPRLTRLLDRRGGLLSGGEQQILAVARALVPSPWLLFLDEPSEGIQPSIVQEIGAILASLRDKHGVSMVIVEQNLELVLDVADRILLLERGRVTRELTASEVRSGSFADLVGLGPGRWHDANGRGSAPASYLPTPTPAPRNGSRTPKSSTPPTPALAAAPG